jgi:hypothetical protein
MALAKFENLMERMMEGSFTRLFNSPIQPAEIAKKLERAVESNQTIGVGKVFVPNHYEVCLNVEDFAAFEPFRQTMAREMATFVTDLAKERRYTVLGRAQVEIRADQNVRRHAIQVASRTVDVAEQPPAVPQEQPGFTKRIDVERVKPVAMPTVSLEVLNGDQAGRRFVLKRGMASIGRGLENDVVIEDPSVSRHHAQIKHRHGQFCLFDLDSTNGTRLNGLPVAESVLGNGDRITLGDVDLVVNLS